MRFISENGGKLLNIVIQYFEFTVNMDILCYDESFISRMEKCNQK